MLSRSTSCRNADRRTSTSVSYYETNPITEVSLGAGFETALAGLLNEGFRNRVLGVQPGFPVVRNASGWAGRRLVDRTVVGR